MNNKFNSKLGQTSKISKRRDVADIISTMFMGLTVTGATLTYFVNDSFISGNLSTASSLDTTTNGSSVSLNLIATSEGYSEGRIL